MTSESQPEFNIHDAKTNLSRIVARVERGEEVILSRAGHPVAKVVPLTRSTRRTGRGSLRGQLVATADWDAPEVNEAIANDFAVTHRDASPCHRGGSP